MIQHAGIRHDRLMLACDKIDEAAMLGEGWSSALEALALAAGSRGVMIMHNRDRKLVSYVSDPNIREPVDLYLAGKAPPNVRQSKIRHDFDPGFRLDFDDFDPNFISRDPYYQDFLRPIGMHWHANARLMMNGTSEIAISFKRELRHGHYDSADQTMLDRILPRLRASAYLAECVLDAETRGMVRALHQRGRAVLEFDARGRVRRQHGRFDGAYGPIIVHRDQALTVDPRAQNAMAKAIDKAIKPPQRDARVLLSDHAGQRYLFQIVPVQGRARDVFFATSAVGVVIGKPKAGSLRFDMDIARELFSFTVREAQIVALLCEGYSTTAIASRLNVVPDTVRFHLKTIFDKNGGRRRAEVVALIAQLVE